MRARDTRAMTEDVWLGRSDKVAVVLPLRAVVVGAEAVAAAWTAWFAVRGARGAVGPEVVRVVSHEVRGGSGWVVCVAGPRGADGPALARGGSGNAAGGDGMEAQGVDGGGTVVSSNVVATNIFQMKNGEWKMVYHSSSPVLLADE
jgi:ketosteroid isomerase-like protein